MKVTADIRVSDSEEDMYKRPGLLSLSFLAVSSSQILDANQVSNYDSLMFVLSNLFQKSVGDGFIWLFLPTKNYKTLEILAECMML